MAKKQKPPPAKLARPEQFSITLSRSDARLVRAVAEALGDGPSGFFQRLLSEARGARLPVVTVLDVAHLPYHSHEWVPPTEE